MTGPAWTPWGAAQHTDEVMPGVLYVSTASHGGYHLTPELNARIPEQVRRPDGWYEHDCDAALPAYFLPFPGANAADALLMIGHLWPDLYAQLIRGDIPAP